jgi:hypothetical protein
MNRTSFPWKRLLKDVAPTIALLLLLRVSILPNHGTRFLSLHPCREEAGFYLLIPLALMLSGLSLLLSYRTSEKLHRVIFFLAGLATAAITILEVIRLPSYVWRLAHQPSTIQNTLFIILGWLILWLLFSFLQKSRSSRWFHLLAAIPLLFSAQVIYRVLGGNALLQQMNRTPSSLGPALTFLFIIVGFPLLITFFHHLILHLQKKPRPATSSFYLEFFTLAVFIFVSFTIFSCGLD